MANLNEWTGRVLAAGGIAVLLNGPAVALDVVAACQNVAQPATAAQACQTAIDSGTWSGRDVAWAWNNLGLAHAADRRFLAAISAYTKALELDPDNTAALSNRGTAHAALGDLIPALADHSKVVELDPKSASAWHNRGTDREDMGQHKKALADYNQAIALDPKHVGAHIGRATANCKLGRVKTSAKARLDAVNKGLIDATDLQVQLQSEGFYRGKIDGVFGKGSRAALRAWTREGCLAPA